MQNRVIQVLITIIIVIVFWNLLDFIIDEYITHEGYVFNVYYDLALPTLVALAVELFPKKEDSKLSSQRSTGKKNKKR